MLPVLAADRQRRWLLLADGGLRLREAFADGLPLDSWAEILVAYADLQLSLAGHVDELLQIGARNRRLALLPTLYDDLLAEREWLLLDQPEGLTEGELQRLLAAAPHVQELCERLSAYAVPASLHHNDLHDANIFAAHGRYLFFDWGDSSISHPFFSLRTAFANIENRFGLSENDPLFERLAQAYWRRWTAYESEERLSTVSNCITRNFSGEKRVLKDKISIPITRPFSSKSSMMPG